MTISRTNRIIEEKPVQAPFCTSQISYKVTWGLKPGLRSEKPVSNCLSYGAACEELVTPVSSKCLQTDLRICDYKI
jgi:hypothetical protein